MGSSSASPSSHKSGKSTKTKKTSMAQMLVKFWDCHACGFDGIVYAYHDQCPMCYHYRCSYCREYHSPAGAANA